MSDGVGELVDEGYRLLEEEEYEQALGVAAKICSLNDPEGYEIGARALDELDRPNDAIAMLNDGVKAHPTWYWLWDRLGGICLDEGRHLEALEAYRQASTCPDADKTMMAYACGTVFNRQGKHQEVLQTVERERHGEGGPPQFAWDAMKSWSLNALGRYRDTLSLVDVMNAVEEVDDEWRETYAAFQTAIARAFLEAEGNAPRALAGAWEAIRAFRGDLNAGDLIREIADIRTPTSLLGTIMVDGRWHEGIEGFEEPPGFFVVYDVVYDNLEEALEFIKPFEPEEVRASLRVEKTYKPEPKPNEPKGVVWTESSHSFYSWEE
jgi:tetratricopeptide (TPR) repeat protein